MTPDDFSSLKLWFSGYVARFKGSPDPVTSENIDLKELHTHEVVRTAREIAERDGMAGRDSLLAEACALLHDVGRFPQFARYRTYRDSESVNHGRLGVEVIGEEGALLDFGPRDREVILHAVLYHNAFSPPRTGDPAKDLHLALVRDADKLDIVRVVLEYFEKPAHEREKVLVGLPDEGAYSREAIDAIMSGRMYSYSGLKTQNDYLLMLVSWVRDLNTQGALGLFAERGLLDLIEAKLPTGDEIARALTATREYLAGIKR